MNARIKPTTASKSTPASKPAKQTRDTAPDLWAELADQRRRGALESASLTWQSARHLLNLQGATYQEFDADDLEPADHITLCRAIEAEKHLLGLILIPQADLAPDHASQMHRVRCRPAACWIDGTLYVAVPRSIAIHDPLGTVSTHPDGSMMELHAVEDDDYQTTTC